ncbi:hypothetical protein APUTEX25_002204 [Auxenochlorella protothecoides]|uniref:Uncharacterized protein n=1 Tax=Auxenochlorella protothecoides TaxID=3075 RepID=A0A3M7KVP5_AUXPR|nr:hypothetical protein APUTEX25_002204 [Auxenochlorella protothecoides]|eukprot:RMZ54618.1 hypothetical protein APUTEX25_002204 [Auxenochlorella protothecoides]
MAEAGLPPHGSDATRPTNTAMSALAQLAQGRELGRSVGPLIQLLLDQGTPHLARSAAYDALIAGGLSDEDWHRGLLLQIASNWRALNAPVQARAVWICAFHLQLQSALDASWTSLVDAVHGLLSDAHSQDSAGHLAAVREGTLSAKVGAQRDVSVAGQNVEVALLCLEHLAALLVDNHKDELVGQLAPVASLLEKLVGLELEACGSRIPGLRARLGRTAWSATRTVSGFGWPVVAASIKLPLKVSLGSPVIRCCPLSISPLVLLNPPTHAVSPVQFYQRWQALPYGLSVQGSLQTPGPAGLSALFAAFAASGTLECVIKSVTPGHGVHAAFHGTSWDGDVVACLLTGLGAGIECSPAGAPILRFTIRSESQAVMDQLAGQEGELLEVLSGGLAVPVADDLALAGASVAPPAIVKTAAPATTPAAAPTQPESSTYSFLRGVTARTFAVEESEPAQAVDGAAALDLEPAAALALARRLDDAAVAAWRRLRETRRLQAATA